MRDRTSIWLFVGAFVLAFCFAAAGYGFYSHKREVIRNTKSAELKVIAKLRAGEIARWRQERLNDARLDSSGIVRLLMQSWTEHAGGENERSELLARMKMFQEVQGYESLIVARPDERVLLSTDPGIVDLEPQARRLIRQAIASNGAVFGELFRCKDCAHVHLDVVSPILDAQDRPIAALILRYDPQTSLFPLVQSWPTPSPSAETQLVRRDGEDALLLNVLRHRVDPALTVRFPLSRTDVTAVQAALGQIGKFEGLDYRGEEVLAEILPVEGSPWFIVSKVDRDELLAPLYDEGRLILIVVTLAIAMTGILGQLANRTRKLRLQQHLLQAEKERRTSEERYRSILHASSGVLSILDLDGRVVTVSPGGVAMFGCDREEELIGHPLTDRILPDDRARASSTIALILSGEAPGPTEYRALRADGGTFVVEINGEVVRDADGQPAQVATIVRDITERKRAEEALAAEKEHLAVTLRSIGDGVITTDVRGTVVLMNRVAEDLTGWKQDEAAGMVLGDIFRIIHQATRLPCEDPVAKVLASGMIVGLANHTVLIAKDGTERVLADSGAPIRNRDSRITGVVLVFRDVTQEHLRKEDLQKAQKLESIGLLAGGIAHDFNNLLTAILGNISLTRLGNASATQQAEWLTEAEKAVGRARDLTQQLLTFSKGGSPIRKTARLGEMIMDSTGFSLRGSNVRCSFSIPEDLWPVEADLCQLSQVISNLVINADEAMPSGGTIRVSGRNLEIGMPRPESLPEGRFVEISVEDEGFGIDEEHLQRVFDPYFTTKKKGNGLGLATSYSIVRHHDGLISVNSKRGHGSTFRMFLPASERQPPPPAVNQAVLPGNGRILVMDDEEMILRVASQMLSFLGYEVETASDGAGAIERFAAAQASSRPFDAVILDITVPGGMGGKETVQRLRASDPDVRAIVSSGYSNDPIMADFRTHGFKGIAVKPYELLSLSRALHDVLSS